MSLTNPSYISEQMFDKVLREKFHENIDDRAVIQQAAQLARLVRGSQSHQQILVDIIYAAKARVKVINFELLPADWKGPTAIPPK